MKYFLEKISENQSLTIKEAFQALMYIGSGEVNNSQISAFLMGIRQKKISVDELKGFKLAMLELAIPVSLEEFDPMDVCGTGGDGKDTFNISTTAAFVVAGAGQKVAKHGNHGVSSAVGSSTVLEYLGVNFSKEVDFLRSKIEKSNICYLHAPLFHPAMRFVGAVRKEMGIKTFFNILGPLLNPAKVKKQLTGVYDLPTFELFYSLFSDSDVKFGIVHALDGFDEISLTGDFKVGSKSEVKIFNVNDLGFKSYLPSQLNGGESLEDSAKIIINVLKNEGTEAQTNAVLANAGLALSVAKDISLQDGIAMAMESLKSGSAFRSLKLLIE